MGTALRILGPLVAEVDGVDVTPSAPKERALLAMLTVHHGQVVSADRLIDELWPDLDARKARRVLQVRITELRTILAAAGAEATVDYRDPGYRLTVAPEAVDAHAFRTVVERARGELRAGDAIAAHASLHAALAMWRDEPLGNVHGGVHLEREAAHLAEARLEAIEDCIDAELACGRHNAVVGELDALVESNPQRERFWGQRVLALYRCGRQVEALRACASLRQQLRDEVGLEPGPELRALESAVLEQRPELDWSPAHEVGRASRREAPLRRAGGSAAMPAVHYARASDGVNVGYRVVGTGPDLIIVPGYFSHLDMWWESYTERLVRRLSSATRLILFDKRGMGLSDRPPCIEIEDWVEDTRAVLDAVGSQRATVMGLSAGGLIATLFAATFPERVTSMVLYGAWPRLRWAEDFPIGFREDGSEEMLARFGDQWGTGVGFDEMCASGIDNPVAREQYARYQRMAASPSSAVAYLRLLAGLDVRDALPAISAPTLVLHASREKAVPIELARYTADHIPGAALVELDSADHLLWFSDVLDVIVDEIYDFVTGGASKQAGWHLHAVAGT